MRLTKGKRHVVQKLHRLAVDPDQLEVLRKQRSNLVEAVERPLVHRDQVGAIRADGVALGRHDVTDVVVNLDLLGDLEVLDRPLGHRRLDEDRGVGVALVVVLGVKRTETDLDLAPNAVRERKNRNAERVLAVVLLRVDEALDLLEAVDRGMRVELARNDQLLAIGGDIHAVRALGLANEMQQTLCVGRVEHDHVHPGDLLGLAGLVDRLSLLEIDDVHVVHVVLGRAGLHRRAAFHRAAIGHLGVERVDEHPALARKLAGVGEVLHVGRELHREGIRRVDLALLTIELPEDHRAAVLLLEVLDRRVPTPKRRRVLARFDDVLGVRRDEGRAVVTLNQRRGDDLLRDEVVQVDDRDASVGLVVHEDVLAVVLTLGLGERRMVHVAPRDLLAEAAPHVEDRAGLVAVPVALPGLWREHADVLQDTHRGNADDDHVAAVAARGEGEILVLLARGRVGLKRCAHIGFSQPALLHQISGRARRCL